MPTATGRVLSVLVVLSHVRRRTVHVNATEQPSAPWDPQEVVDAFRRTRRRVGCIEIETVIYNPAVHVRGDGRGRKSRGDALNLLVVLIILLLLFGGGGFYLGGPRVGGGLGGLILLILLILLLTGRL